MDTRPQHLASIDIEHLDKYPMQRLGKICDFTASGLRFQEQRMAKSKGKGKPFQALMPKKDDEGFSLVAKDLPTKGPSKGRGGGKMKGKGKTNVNYQEGILGQKQKTSYSTQQTKGKGKGQKGQKGKGKGRGFANRGRPLPSHTQWAIQTKTEWSMKWEIMLSQLSKVQIDSRQVQFEDIMWCGELRDYNRDMDRIMVRTEKRLTRFEDVSFFNESTTNDPHLPEILQSDDSVTLVATDQVLAAIIASARSVYSWDIIVTKVKDAQGNDKLIFDKRDNAPLDFLTVNETAQQTPDVDDKNSHNTPLKLGNEASCINQNFSQMVLDGDVDPCTVSSGGAGFEPNPFDEDGDGNVASGAYRYRKIMLPGNPKDDDPIKQRDITIAVRTEVNCKLPGKNGSLVSTKALNEYDPSIGLSWRLCLESQRGAILANELKNNSFKMGRWVAQAMLSGCEQIKLGYVSRQDPMSPWNHAILGIQTYYIDGFGEQIGLTANNAYGILRSIIDNVLSWEDGRYLLMKDPTKAIMRFYQVPWDAFDEEEEEDDFDEEEDQDVDEDGQALPEQPSVHIPQVKGGKA